MALPELSRREILQAVAEYDQLGQDGFLEKHEIKTRGRTREQLRQELFTVAMQRHQAILPRQAEELDGFASRSMTDGLR